MKSFKTIVLRNLIINRLSDRIYSNSILNSKDKKIGSCTTTNDEDDGFTCKT